MRYESSGKDILKMRTRILTIGTAGMITALRCGHYPAPGESVTADRFFMWPGGRGLLSAIAASKLGGDSLLCAAVGDDWFGPAIKEYAAGSKDFRTDTRFICEVRGGQTSVSALIRTPSDETKMSVPAVSYNIPEDTVEEAVGGSLPDSVLIQCGGISPQTALCGADHANRLDIPIILDLIEVGEDYPIEKFKHADIAILSEQSARLLSGASITGEQSALRAAGAIERRLNVRYTIIMLDERRGIFLSDNKYHNIFPYLITSGPADSMAAEETFIAALTLDYTRGIKNLGRDIDHAVKYALLARAWTLSHHGLASSMPKDRDLRMFAKGNNIKFEFYDEEK